MKIEIAIEGPWEAIQALHGKLPDRREKPEQGAGEDPQRARLVLIEEETTLNACLIAVSRIVDRDLRVADQLEFRVRNLAYSEPAPWDDSLREPFRPVPSLTIQPWSASASRPTDPHTVLLDSRLAFGTGRHPTTELCLKVVHALSLEPGGLRGKKVLDFGCGTGLLVMAAIRLGARCGQGIEMDAEAAATAQRNVALNGLSGRIVISCGSWESVRGPADLLLANLVPAVLLRTGSEIPLHLNEQGCAVVSGFSRNQAKEMKDFFAHLGLRTMERLECRGWAALVMEKKKT